jgi:hypothetical protein
MSPKVSVEMTFLMFAAKRCSFVASASPSVSRDVATTKASSFHRVGVLPVASDAREPDVARGALARGELQRKSAADRGR